MKYERQEEFPTAAAIRNARGLGLGAGAETRRNGGSVAIPADEHVGDVRALKASIERVEKTLRAAIQEAEELRILAVTATGDSEVNSARMIRMWCDDIPHEIRNIITTLDNTNEQSDLYLRSL